MVSGLTLEGLLIVCCLPLVRSPPPLVCFVHVDVSSVVISLDCGFLLFFLNKSNGVLDSSVFREKKLSTLADTVRIYLTLKVTRSSSRKKRFQPEAFSAFLRHTWV